MAGKRGRDTRGFRWDSRSISVPLSCMAPVSNLDRSLTAQAALLTELMASAIEPSLHEAGLTHSAFDLLSAIQVSDGATQADLARRLRVSTPTLSEALRPLVAKGLVEINPSRSDRRANAVFLTSAGAKAMSSAMKTLSSFDDEIKEALEDRELQIAIAVMRKASIRLAAKIQDSLQD